MTVRNIKKNLAGMEDLLQGVGTESQSRAGSLYNIHKVDVPYAVQSKAELTALDVTKYTRARVYSSTTTFINYIYDPADTSGIAPDVGAGSWIISSTFTSLADFNTADDDVNDAAIGLNAAIASGAKHIVIPKPAVRYALLSPVNMTALRGVTFWCTAGSNLNEPPFRIAHTGVGFDCTESFDLRFYDFSFYGDPTTSPSVGLLLARSTLGASAGRHRFVNCASTGKFTTAPVYSYGSEENDWFAPQLHNSQPNKYAIVITANNVFNITSTFATIATGGQSNVVSHFYAPSFIADGNGGTQLESAVYFESAGNVTLESPFTYTPYGQANIYIDTTNGTSDVLRIKGWRGEVNALKPTYGIVIGNEAVRTHANWEIDGQCDCVNEVLYGSPNASLLDLTMNNMTAPSGKLIDVANLYDSEIHHNSSSVTCRTGGVAARNIFKGYGSALTISGTDTTNTKIDTLTGSLNIAGNDVLPTTGTWTPVVTCATAGDLSVTYATQVGRYHKLGNLVTVQGSITTSAFTHTTASGALKITGLPYTGLNTQYGALDAYSGFTSAGYESLSLQMAATAELYINKAGSAVANTNSTITDWPSGGTVVINFVMSYFV